MDTNRLTIPTAEEILDVAFPVLDHGFVRLVDYLGGDDRIVQAARVSTGSGVKTPEEDRRLIDYLWRNKHSSPFEQCVITFHVKLPIFVARQWVRHRTGRLNEVSGRYSVLPSDFYIPDVSRIQGQSTTNKQGSGEPLSPELAIGMREHMRNVANYAYARYDLMLKSGVAREIARMVLPVNIYTEWYWQFDLNNLFKFITLRGDAHAQWEIQQYALALAEIARAVAPVAFAAFKKYQKLDTLSNENSLL